MVVAQMQDMELAGVRIPKGASINTAQYSFQHNPKYWKDPEKFEPERFLDVSVAETPQWAVFGDGMYDLPSPLPH